MILASKKTASFIWNSHPDWTAQGWQR